jgi:hypothetical protein
MTRPLEAVVEVLGFFVFPPGVFAVMFAIAGLTFGVLKIWRSRG